MLLDPSIPLSAVLNRSCQGQLEPILFIEEDPEGEVSPATMTTIPLPLPITHPEFARHLGFFLRISIKHGF